MRFELDNILLENILFYMENQDGDFLLDTLERQVIDILNDDFEEEIDADDKERFIPLPQWLPSDGYRLMEKFSANVKNPVIRHELAEALNRNKGVFRAFRNVLEQYGETEKMWFSYKDTEMKKVVTLWYNSLREEWGLAPIGNEPEDTSSLVLEDFFIKETSESGKGSVIIFAAENINGEIAGSIKGSLINSVLHIDTLEVKTEYQGLGLGKTLLSRLLEETDKKNIDVIIDLPSDVEYFSRSLFLENFKISSQRFMRKAH